MSVTITYRSSAGANIGFTPQTWNASVGGVLGTGDIYLFIPYEGSAPTITSVVVGGVTQNTALLTSNTGANVSRAVYVCSGVNTANGNIDITFGGFPNAVGVSWFLVTGAGTPTASKVDSTSFPPEPVTTTASVPSGGVSMLGFFIDGINSPSAYSPFTWSGCVSSSSLSDFAIPPTSNGGQIVTNYATASGTVGLSSSNNLNGQSGGFIEVDIPAAGGGGSPVLLPQRRIFTRRKRPDFTGWNPIRDPRARSALIVPERKLILPRGYRKAA